MSERTPSAAAVVHFASMLLVVVPVLVLLVLVLVVPVVVVLDVTALHIDVPVAPTLTPKAPSAERCVDQHEDPYQGMTESFFQVDL